MTSLGKLIDELSVLELRAEKETNPEIKPRILQQVSELLLEIDDYMACALDGSIPPEALTRPKFKNYAYQDNTVPMERSLAVAINRLFKANRDLWNMEDERRNPALSIEAKAKLADEVSLVNKTRNDAADQIDFVLQAALEARPPKPASTDAALLKGDNLKQFLKQQDEEVLKIPLMVPADKPEEKKD